MIDKNKSEIINKFLDRFSISTVRSLYAALDKDVYKQIELNIESYDFVEDIGSKKENNIIYKQNYKKGKKDCVLAVLVPEELVASISDVFMGGKGEDVYKGSLTELEINATFNLLNTIFKGIIHIYNRICEQEIVFESSPILFDKSSKDYDKTFTSLNSDFVVNYSLRFNNVKDYKIKLLLSFSELKHTLTRLGLLKWEFQKTRRNLEAVNIDVISDLEIDLSAELGTAQLPMKCALELSKGSLIELNSFEGSHVKVYAKGAEIAEAQVVVVGENLGLRLIKLISPEERIRGAK